LTLAIAFARPSSHVITLKFRTGFPRLTITTGTATTILPAGFVRTVGRAALSPVAHLPFGAIATGSSAAVVSAHAVSARRRAAEIVHTTFPFAAFTADPATTILPTFVVRAFRRAWGGTSAGFTDLPVGAIATGAPTSVIATNRVPACRRARGHADTGLTIIPFSTLSAGTPAAIITTIGITAFGRTGSHTSAFKTVVPGVTLSAISTAAIVPTGQSIAQRRAAEFIFTGFALGTRTANTPTAIVSTIVARAIGNAFPFLARAIRAKTSFGTTHKRTRLTTSSTTLILCGTGVAIVTKFRVVCPETPAGFRSAISAGIVRARIVVKAKPLDGLVHTGTGHIAAIRRTPNPIGTIDCASRAAAPCAGVRIRTRISVITRFRVIWPGTPAGAGVVDTTKIVRAEIVIKTKTGDGGVDASCVGITAVRCARRPVVTFQCFARHTIAIGIAGALLRTDIPIIAKETDSPATVIAGGPITGGTALQQTRALFTDEALITGAAGATAAIIPTFILSAFGRTPSRISTARVRL
jgi:hypothetical protein